MIHRFFSANLILLLICLVSLAWISPVVGAGGILSPKNLYTLPNDASSKAKGINLLNTAKGQEDSFVNVVKGAVNRVLGILALIALIILLYGGFLMVTSAGDEEQYKKGFTILKHAATGLLLIGVAWFIVSIIFRLANKITDNPGTAGTET